MIQYVFFDVGNTLFSEDQAIEHRIRETVDYARALGMDITYNKFYQTMIEASWQYEASLYHYAVRKLGIPYKAPYLHSLDKPFEGALEVVKSIRKRYKTGVIANQSKGTAERLEASGFAPYIDLCIASAEEGIAKPDVQIYKRALFLAGCRPQNSVMVGDRLDNDIYPAKKAGMKTIRVLQGFGKYQEPLNEEYIADITLNDIRELREYHIG